MCNCKEDTIPQTKECYSNMITVDIPKHMSDYSKARLNKGLSNKVSIDPCIFEEIKYLWSNNITTYGSCCGHNILPAFVNVKDSDINKMLELGYVQQHWDKSRKDTFRLKSVKSKEYYNE